MPTTEKDPIRHVVVLILENHSFDQMLGSLKAVYSNLDGIDPKSPGQNLDSKGRSFQQNATATRQIVSDPHHEVEHVKVQLENKNSGFIRDFETAYPNCTDDDRRYIMSYYSRGDLPGLHTLGEEFTVCDRWHASLPGPTWPNRFFALTGTSCGFYDMPDDGSHSFDIKGYFEQDQDTIFDRLSEKGYSWKCYFSGFPQTVVLRHQRQPERMARYFPMEQFIKDSAGAEVEFPAFSLIEPDFMGEGENDDHPPHDVMKAQKLIADVYNAIRANQQLWMSTLLVIFYDEHGGFYDHVEPPEATPPDANDQYPFNRYGVRVPAVMVSPWVAKGVCSTLFDHTSVLRYLIDKWSLDSLGKRASQANSIGTAIQSSGSPRMNTIPKIALPASAMTPPILALERESMNHSHSVALAMLWTMIKEQSIEQAGPIDQAIHFFRAGIAGIQIVLGLKDPAEVIKAEFALYHREQQRSARDELTRIVQDAALDGVKRRHAAEALGYLVGVPFGSSADPTLAAKSWLSKDRAGA